MRSAWETFSCPSNFLSKWLGHKNTDLGIRTYPQQLAYGHVQLLAHEYSICIRFISWSKDWQAVLLLGNVQLPWTTHSTLALKSAVP